MIEYEPGYGDLVRVRFAISPLCETVLSLRAWWCGGQDSTPSTVQLGSCGPP